MATRRYKTERPIPFTKSMAEAACMIASGMTLTEAARSIGVKQQTLKKWSQRDDFKAAMQQAIDEVLTGCIPSAVNRLKKMIESKNDWVSMGAIRLLFDLTSKNKQQDDQNVIVNFSSMLPPGAPETSGDIKDSEDDDDILTANFVEDE